MRRTPGLVLFLLMLLVVPSPAVAESVLVDDDEPGHEAYFLAIKKARFTNAETAVTVRVRHPGLVPDYVDRWDVWILVGKKRPSTERDRYILRREAGELRLLIQSPGQETPSELSCRGDRMRIKAADSRSGTAGSVRARIPHRCLASSKSVRVGYLVHNEGGQVTDTAPGSQGCCVPGMTRWLRRG